MWTERFQSKQNKILFKQKVKHSEIFCQILWTFVQAQNEICLTFIHFHGINKFLKSYQQSMAFVNGKIPNMSAGNTKG